MVGHAAFDPALQAKIGHTGGVGGLVGAHLVATADELLGAQAFVLSQRHDESRQVWRGFVPVDTGRNNAIGPVLVRQPLQGLLKERFFLFWCSFLEPIRLAVITYSTVKPHLCAVSLAAKPAVFPSPRPCFWRPGVDCRVRSWSALCVFRSR